MWIDINKNNILRKEEKEMENKKLVVKGTRKWKLWMERL